MKRSKNNIGKPAYDERKVKQSIKLGGGGLSRDTLLSMLKNEYPSSYTKEIESSSTEQIKDLLDYLDSLKAMKAGGLVSNYKKDLRKP